MKAETITELFKRRKYVIDDIGRSELDFSSICNDAEDETIRIVTEIIKAKIAETDYQIELAAKERPMALPTLGMVKAVLQGLHDQVEMLKK